MGLRVCGVSVRVCGVGVRVCGVGMSVCGVDWERRCRLGKAIWIVMSVCERRSCLWMVTSMTVSVSLSME